MYLVRFNLEAGPNFGQWQIRNDNFDEYYSPDSVCLLMHQCRLRNKPKIAQKIYDGENKRVCAWIECDHVDVLPTAKVDNPTFERLYYNPRVKPYWTDGDSNLDNEVYHEIVTDGRKLFGVK